MAERMSVANECTWPLKPNAQLSCIAELSGTDIGREGVRQRQSLDRVCEKAKGLPV